MPDDVNVTFEFDQTPVVLRAINDLVKEGAIGAVLTGLMVLALPARLAQRVHRRAEHPDRAARRVPSRCG